MTLKPDFVEAHNNLGNASKARGDLDEAVASYRRALALRPDSAPAHNNLGVALSEQGRLDEAVASHRRALELEPGYAEAHNNLGNAFQGQERLDEATACYRRALELRPDYAPAHNNLGNASKARGDLDEAVASYRRALALRPAFVEGHNNLGVALLERGDLDEAVASCRHAVRLRPDYAAAHNNLGNIFQERGDLDEAVASHRRALELDPGCAEAHNNLGSALLKQGRLEEAMASYRHARDLRPEYAEAHMNLGMALLLAGDFEGGWAGYEWRLRTKDYARDPSRQPRWDGSPLRGRTILVHAEQGLGDTIQFVRYAPMVRERGGVVVLECQPPLMRLLADAPGIDRLLAQGGPPPEFAVQSPLLSLPGILGTTLDTIPAPVPYLRADAARMRLWRRELGDSPESRVGIVWRGNPGHRSDRRRSIPLSCLAPLAGLPGVRLVSLQKGPGAEQLDAQGWGRSVLDLGGRLEDFVDTAAVLMNLDLLIACDTAVAHLAGALGVPAWVALPSDPDWRWLLGRDDSPWYPSLRLFRQDRPGDWEAVFDRIARELPRQVARPGGDGSAGPGG